jgi:hypothetical protein
MSVTSTGACPSPLNKPIEMPATGALIFTPASISARVPAQILAMEEEPFEPMISETTRTV